ncbi:20 kDa chaperonin, chloroplastic [Canna indica]|uniref:20 kDa chaperonin, chloroplastic n=1 Tax=Canna indica TaxID=4628 RepID=A0AAQ3QMT0_9LILI|nr:20 kDa chaperonin, chloroplastic [Canna indica]
MASMASLHFSISGIAAAKRSVPSFDGLRLSPSALRLSFSVGPCGAALHQSSFRRLVVKAATVVAPKYTSIKPLGDRVLVKINTSEEVTIGGILLPSSSQQKPQAGEVVAVGEGRTIGNKKLQISIKEGAQVIYSRYAGTELEFNGSNHIILKEDDIVGILEAEDVKDLQPLNDRVLIKIAEAEETTPGGLLLTEASKEKPSVGTVITVGPGTLDEEGTRKPLTIASGSSVLYSKYAGSEFKSADGSTYVVLKASDVMAVLS